MSNFFDQHWQDIRGMLAAPTAMPEETTDRQPLTPTQRKILGWVGASAFVIAGIGFTGSYAAVRTLALHKGFGDFSYVLPIGVDVGIAALLALDLVLTWLRIPFQLLRYTAWLLTAATVVFNAASSWGDDIAVGMHAVIPLLFVVIIEAGRHAVGRLANIAAARHIESPPLIRWILSPTSTFRIWRRMRMWQLVSYNTVIELERETRIHRKKLRLKHGRRWRSHAAAADLLALTLARYGTPVHETLATQAAELSAERERALAESALQAPGESTAPVGESDRETAGEGDSRALTPKRRESGGKKKPQRRRRESAPASGGESASAAVSPIADIERETAALVALMIERGGAEEVSLPDAERITGKSQATAARRLSTARTRYRKSA